VKNIFTDVGTLPPNSVYPVFIQGERRVTAKPAFTYNSSTLATGYPVPIPTGCPAGVKMIVTPRNPLDFRV